MPDLFSLATRAAPRQLAVARAMRDYGLSIGTQTIADVTGMTIKDIRNALARMHRQLRVQKIGDGYWELTRAGREWIKEVTRG